MKFTIPGVVPKPFPRILTFFPADPEVGLTLVIFGRITRLPGLTAVFLAAVEILKGPLRTFLAGTWTLMDVGVQSPTATLALPFPKLTLPVLSPKNWPVIVMKSPTNTFLLLKSVIFGNPMEKKGAEGTYSPESTETAATTQVSTKASAGLILGTVQMNLPLFAVPNLMSSHVAPESFL